MKNILRGTWLLIVGMTVFSGGPAQAQITSNGPYYATPSWDQKLDPSTRFIILSNWNNEAVLDRETGLVWERSPDTETHQWLNGDAPMTCAIKRVGGRMGWRLPSVHELASLIDPEAIPSGRQPTLPLGHPFINVQTTLFVNGTPSFPGYWSGTTASICGTNPQGDCAWVVSFNSGFVTLAAKEPVETHSFFTWCVRGGGPLATY